MPPFLLCTSLTASLASSVLFFLCCLLNGVFFPPRFYFCSLYILKCILSTDVGAYTQCLTIIHILITSLLSPGAVRMFQRNLKLKIFQIYQLLSYTASTSCGPSLSLRSWTAGDIVISLYLPAPHHNELKVWANVAPL